MTHTILARHLGCIMVRHIELPRGEILRSGNMYYGGEDYIDTCKRKLERGMASQNGYTIRLRDSTSPDYAYVVWIPEPLPGEGEYAL